MSGERQASTLTRRRAKTAWLFLAPTLIALVMVGLWPLTRTLWLSLTDARLGDAAAASFIGFANYRLLLGDAEWWNAVRNTLIFAASSVAIETVLGIVFALVMNARFRGRGLVRAAILVPWAIPLVVSGKMWAWMYNDLYGVINAALLGLGVIAEPIAWLAAAGLAMAVVVATDVWKTTPFMALLILAALQMVPKDVYEAARLDGVSPVVVFFRITLPLIRPVLLVAVIFRTLDALRIFDLIYIMTSNSRQTATMSIFARRELVEFADVGYGSAASVLIFLIVGLCTLAYLWLARLRPEEASP
ncbi:MAG: carbohydrate ABC transporter permease [Rhodospirillales bacterium]